MSLYEVIGRIGPPDCGRVGEFKLDLSDCPFKDRMLNRLISCPGSPGLVEASDGAGGFHGAGPFVAAQPQAPGSGWQRASGR